MSAKQNIVKGYCRPEIIERFNDSLQAFKDRVNAGDDLHVTISHGNSKMGEVASVSTLPFITCPARCRETCGRDCYAAKIANLYKTVRESYAKNTALAMLNPALFWREVDGAVKAVRYFRFHVSGDIVNYEYFENIVKTAANNAHCEILVFTKRYEIVNRYCDINGRAAIPGNLHILFSGWQGLEPVNPFDFPETNVFTCENEIKPDWKLCGGNCFTCACRGVGCWQAGAGETVAFKKH